MIPKSQLRPMLAKIFYTTANNIGMKITMAEAWELVERLSDDEVLSIVTEGYYNGKALIDRATRGDSND